MLIEEAKRKLELLSQVEKYPRIVFTELYKGDGDENADEVNFFYRIEPKGKYILDYLKEAVMKIPQFEGCDVRIHGARVNVHMPALKYGEHQSLQPEDFIMSIELNSKSFVYQMGSYENYKRIMQEEYEYEEAKLDPYLQEVKAGFSSFGNRMKKAFTVWKKKKNFISKISDFFFWLLGYKKAKAQKVIAEREAEIASWNRFRKERYEDQLAMQMFFKENAPDHLTNIEKKQYEIAAFLTELGYQEGGKVIRYW